MFRVTVKSDTAPVGAPAMDIGFGAKPPRGGGEPEDKRTGVIHFTQHACMVVHGRAPFDALRPASIHGDHTAFDAAMAAFNNQFGPPGRANYDRLQPTLRCCVRAKGSKVDSRPRYTLSVAEVTCQYCLNCLAGPYSPVGGIRKADDKRFVPHERQVEIAWLRCCHKHDASPFTPAVAARVLRADNDERRARQVERVIGTVDLTVFTVFHEKKDAAKQIAKVMADLDPDLRRLLAPFARQATATIPALKREANKINALTRRLRSVARTVRSSRQAVPA